MTLAISLDIETLSTAKNAVVLSIGACSISLNGEPQRTFHVRLFPQEQIDMGRHVSWETIKWWVQQDRRAQEAAFTGHVLSADAALDALEAWLAEDGFPPVWTKGPAFDGAILESLAEDLGRKPAWAYRLHRDVRTIEDAIHNSGNESLQERFFIASERASAGKVAHNALEDAKMQGALVEWWLKELRDGS